MKIFALALMTTAMVSTFAHASSFKKDAAYNPETSSSRDASTVHSWLQTVNIVNDHDFTIALNNYARALSQSQQNVMTVVFESIGKSKTYNLCKFDDSCLGETKNYLLNIASAVRDLKEADYTNPIRILGRYESSLPNVEDPSQLRAVNDSITDTLSKRNSGGGGGDYK
jgi:hypothetical protein